MKNLKVPEIISSYIVVFKVIKEGYTIQDKIVLFLSIFNSLGYYILNRISNPSMRLCYCVLKDCFIKNRSGIFFCRARTNDALIVSDTHEAQFKQIFDEIKIGNFVDIGAHVGKYTVKIARQLQDGGKVIAIEAHPQNFVALSKNIEYNKLSNAVALNFAVWSKNCDLKFYRDTSSTASTSFSAVDSYQGDYINANAKKIDDILSEIGIQMVDFMKIDVEGAEPHVLLGAERLLREHRIKKILFECNNDSVKERCESILNLYQYELRNVGFSYYMAQPSMISAMSNSV